MFYKFIFLIFFKIVLCLSECINDKNHCQRCNPITKLCVKCDLDIFVPDKEGGCKNSNKCKTGSNYCYECSEDETNRKATPTVWNMENERQTTH